MYEKNSSVTCLLDIFYSADEIEDDLLANKVNGLFTHADNDSSELLSIQEHNLLVLEGDVDGK